MAAITARIFPDTSRCGVIAGDLLNIKYKINIWVVKGTIKKAHIKLVSFRSDSVIRIYENALKKFGRYGPL